MRERRRIGATARIGPVTAARIELAMDKLALIIDRLGEGGLVYLPIYQRLERELESARSAEGALHAIRERVRRSRDRTAA